MKKRIHEVQNINVKTIENYIRSTIKKGPIAKKIKKAGNKTVYGRKQWKII